MPFHPASRGLIPPFLVMDVLARANARAAAGLPVYHLEIGQPATPAPAGVLAAAQRQLHTDRLGYTEALGIAPLRQRIAADYAERYGISVDWKRIVITTGSLGGFQLALLACFERGDRVALCRPCYPSYRHLLRLFDLEPVFLDLPPHEPLTAPRLLAALAQATATHGDVRGVWLANPDNPTGRMLPPDDVRQLARHCHDAGWWLLMDEIYHGLTYTQTPLPAFATSPTAISINSFSKYYSMTGWRLGWMVIPPSLQRAVDCLAQNLFICAPTLSQQAAVAAFDCRAELDGHVTRYRRHREQLLAALPARGFRQMTQGDGAFYLYAHLGELLATPAMARRGITDSRAFCYALLDETGVALTPGWDFDDCAGGEWLRFSYAGLTDETLEAALQALGDFCNAP